MDVISDQAAIANVLMHYADRCQQELLSVAPGRLPTTRIDGRSSSTFGDSTGSIPLMIDPDIECPAASMPS